MRWIKLILIFVLVLIINHFSAWNYKFKDENPQPENNYVTMPASHRYSRLTPLKWLFLGENYREEWSKPVNMPVFHLLSTKGGFEIERLGGGEQTKKLHLIQRQTGKAWELRSIDKNVTKAMPSGLQKTFAQRIVQDQISASFPYGLPIVFYLSEKAGIKAPDPVLFFVPDDLALGKYRNTFAEKVCYLLPKTPFSDKPVFSTDSMNRLLRLDNFYQIDQKQVLNCRLMDILVADWDRHNGQWTWEAGDSLNSVFFKAIPEDRDQAFFRAHGLLPWIVRYSAMPQLAGFTPGLNNIKELSRKSWNFDKEFLNGLDKKDWEEVIRNFKASLTDTEIKEAVRLMPPEIFKITGKEFEEILISRKNDLLKNGLRYYEFLSESVQIRSTLKPEIFIIRKQGDETSVTVLRKQDRNIIYNRKFHKGITSEIKITDIDSDDEVQENGNTTIKIRLEKRRQAGNRR